MVCFLDKTSVRSCVLQSPLIADTFSWTCMRIEYRLSSYDVQFTLDVLADDEPIESYSLSADETAIWIRNPGLQGSPISIKFTASRYLVSNEDYVYAHVSSVAFLQCPANTSKLLGVFVYKSHLSGNS